MLSLEPLSPVLRFPYPKSAPAAAFPRARSASASSVASSAPPRDSSDATVYGSHALHFGTATHASADGQTAWSFYPGGFARRPRGVNHNDADLSRIRKL